MTSLVLSVVALAVGPVLHRVAVTRRSTLSALDSFVFVAISGLVLLHIIPSSFRLAGWAAAVAALLGLVSPGLAERLLHRAAEHVHLLFLVVAMVGFGGHAFLDGMALSEPHSAPASGTSPISLAIVIHRLPDGLTIWWLLREPYGLPAAAATLGFMAVSTVAGFFFVGAYLPARGQSWLGVVQALVAGTLIHVVLHRPRIAAQPEDRPAYLPTILGAVVAGALLWIMEEAHDAADGSHRLPYLGLCAFVVLLVVRFGFRRWLARVFAHHHADDHHHGD
jgi:hypothetical protein